jgi:hypothetical protein
MKSLLLTVAIICLLVAGCTKAKEEKHVSWVYTYNTSWGKVYYDKENIVKVDKDIAKVQVRVVFSGKGKKDFIKENGKEYENVSHILSHVNLNCSSREYYEAYANLYDISGKSIESSGESPDPKWNPIVPRTSGEALYNAVCKDKK